MAEEITSPSGQSFTPIGPRTPVELQAAPPIRAEGSEDFLATKCGGIFVCSALDGDINASGVSGEGVYYSDTRFLSKLTVRLGGQRPVVLRSSAKTPFHAIVDATNPELTDPETGSVAPQLSIEVRRERVVAERVVERATLHNYSGDIRATTLESEIACDFADIFEIRGVSQRLARGTLLEPHATDDGLVFAYLGEDGNFRETHVSFDPPPGAVERTDGGFVVRWVVELPALSSTRVEISIEPRLARRGAPPRRTLEEMEAGARVELDEWLGDFATVVTDDELVTRSLQRAAVDLWALLTPVDGEPFLTAGIPWYVAPFGRDAIITALQTLAFKPSIARDVLRFLAVRQATTDDPARDAEPGKILHEIRFGELARAGIVPHSPYYGSVDSTPLFVALAGAYLRATGDLDTAGALEPHVAAALRWIDEHGDSDGDGFVDYLCRSPAGLFSQGWKDSGDAVVHPDGSVAEPPVALVEVQAYVYLARLEAAFLYERLGEPEKAARLRAAAAELRRRFDDAFWMPEEGFYAFALDGHGRQVTTVTSNPGHALYCGIVPEERAGAVAERLMASDLFSGWGLRTLSRTCPAYNPLSYHRGSVWPHDTAICAAGLRRYGFTDAAHRLARALFDATTARVDGRLPELYCGFEREREAPFVPYPVACSPQAWAAGALFMVVQSMLGIVPAAIDGVLEVDRPALPEWLGWVGVRDLSVGKARVDLAFHRHRDSTAFSLEGRSGDVAVRLSH